MMFNIYILAALYTVGANASQQISQVITPSETPVTVDSQDASRFAYYPVQGNESNQGMLNYILLHGSSRKMKWDNPFFEYWKVYL